MGWRSARNVCEWIGSAYAFCQVNEKLKNAEQNFQFNFFSIAPTLRQINYWMRSLQCLQCIFLHTHTRSHSIRWVARFHLIARASTGYLLQIWDILNASDNESVDDNTDGESVEVDGNVKWVQNGTNHNFVNIIDNPGQSDESGLYSPPAAQCHTNQVKI